MVEAWNPGDRRREGADGPAAPAQDGPTSTDRDCLDLRQVPDTTRAWRLLMLAEVVDFTAVRRELGVAETRATMRRIAARIAAGTASGLSADTLGGALVEIEGTVVDPSRVNELAAALADALAADPTAGRVQLRIGGAFVPCAVADDVTLIEAAEAALTRAIPAGPVELIDLTRPDPSVERRARARDLPGAIARGELVPHYQPKVHLRQHRIASAEALIRWQHPVHGLIFPGAFIDLAEESGVIAELTLWTLRRVIEDQRRLRRHGHDFPVYINISGQLLANSGFVTDVADILRDSGATIGFEITETSVIRDPDSAIANLRAFSEMGIPLAIDDYGAGLSSLSYLKQLPASELKIDKLFVTQLTSSHRDPLIVRSTIDLAHALDMEVTAEGVESPAALALLSVMGCDMAQGYLIGRPVGIDAFIAYCDTNGHFDATQGAQAGFAGSAGFWRRSG